MLMLSKFIPEDDHVLEVKSEAVEMAIHHSFHLFILPANDITAPGPSPPDEADTQDAVLSPAFYLWPRGSNCFESSPRPGSTYC